MIDGGTWRDDSGTLMDDGCTLTVCGDTLMSDGQHRLGNAVTNMTRLRHHQAKQHPQDEDLTLHVT
jgi:hypothetical protein